ncbi:ferredoxin [Sedimentibacter sp.]|uniref:ferredoxin n=1 Tax=Sedimentibacter sp. TaxID=1960295 RepID=UPI0028AC69F9|nr:ferredoxin [Sedimentibacter sp.]
MKAIVDRDACISCGLCVSLCPEVFELDDESISVVIQDPVALENEDCAKESEDSCPTSAILCEE